MPICPLLDGPTGSVASTKDESPTPPVLRPVTPRMIT
jgi:hypothetical protein